MTGKRLALAMIRLASSVVPAWRRPDWVREWHSELDHDASHALPRASGALVDALCLRGEAMQIGVEEAIVTDFRYALRLFRRNPGFTLLAILVLAIGIGADTAIFTVVNAVLLRELPYRDANRLVVVWESIANGQLRPVSYPNFLDWRAQSRSFDALVAYSPEQFSLTGVEQDGRMTGELVSADYFRLLGVEPALGRDFRAEEDGVGAAPVVLVSYGAWQRRFGGDPNLLGRGIRLNGSSWTVVGIMPRGFAGFSGTAEAWVPIALRDLVEPETAQFSFLATRDIHWHRVVARLRPGVTLEAASTEMETIADRLAQTYPNANAKRSARVIAAREALIGALRTPLMLLFGMVALVLLIACANVAHLLLAGTAARARELAIRTALGVTRPRLVRQLLTESVLLTMIGGIAGIVIAAWGLDLLVSILPFQLPRFTSVTLDRQVLAFGLGVAFVMGIVLGLVPARRASSGTDLQTALKDSAAAAGDSRQRRFSGLVVGEVALALIVLIGAGLMVRSFRNMQRVDLGFRSDHLLLMRFDVPSATYQGEARARLAQELIDRVQTVPGLQSAAVADTDLFVWSGINRGFNVEGHAPLPPAERDSVYFQDVTPGFFQTMGIPVRHGRDVATTDTARTPRVAVVSESFARRYWPGHDPLGKHITLGPANSPGPALVIVGVVGDVKFDSLRQDPAAETVVYVPLTQTEMIKELDLIVRSRTDPVTLAGPLRREIRAFDANIPVYNIATAEERLAGQIAGTRAYAWLIGFFGLVAMVLAVAGIYGVMAYSVTKRTREIGIRMALGARRADVLRLVIGQGMTLAGIGVAAGVGVAVMATRVLGGLLFGVSATDPLTFVAVAGLLAIVALGATLIPARRAMRVDPMVALRYE